LLDKAIDLVAKSDILVIIGTSMQVYPAASLINYCKPDTPIFLIDPKPAILVGKYENITIIEANATKGMQQLLSLLKF